MSSSGALPVPDASKIPAPARRWVIFSVLASVAFMSQLDLYIVNVALPAISVTYPGSTVQGLSWVPNAYAIALAVLLVPSGRIADHLGRRRTLLCGVAVFVGASIICAAAPAIEVLVAGRVFQGVGAAMTVPTSLALLYPVFPREQHDLVVGLWAGVAAIAAAAGPSVGGVLVALDWRWVFLVNVPIGGFTLIVGLITLPEVRGSIDSRLPDVVSTLALLVAVTLATLILVQSPDWGWTSTITILCLAGCGLAMAVTLRQAIREPRAIIEARLFRHRRFAVSCLALFLFFLGFGTYILTSVLFLQEIWRYSPTQIGLAIAPGPLAASIFAVGSARIVHRFGWIGTSTGGALAFSLAGALWWASAGPTGDYVSDFLPGLLLSGVGAGLIQAPLFAAASTLEASRATTASAILNMARQVGSAIGVAVLVAFVATDPDPLRAFQKTWLFLVASCIAAAIVLQVGRGRVTADGEDSASTLGR